MEFEPVDLKKLLKQFVHATNTSANEEELKISLEESLKTFFDKYNIEYDPRYEMRAFQGRLDAVFGSIIIEYERPKSLSIFSNRNHAITQLMQYIPDYAKLNNLREDSLLGIALDGENIIYVRWRDEWVISRRYKVNLRSLPVFLECFRGLHRKPLTSQSLTRDFGINSSICIQMMATLLDQFQNRTNTRTQIFFEEWKNFFSESCGYDFQRPKQKMVELAEKFGRNKEQVADVMFCLHTYFSLVLTLLASEIVSLRTKTVFEGYLEFLLNLERNKLPNFFQKMPEGGRFVHSGIKNFLEGAFFWWFTDEWSEQLEDNLYVILGTLNKYEPAYSLTYNHDVKDVLKELYEDLIPRGVRHDLGEYYTPNWIAEYVVNNISIDEETRILDPACGSGTFLIHAIDRFKQQYGSSLSEFELLQMIRRNIVGFDLNPVAIITARTNYLLAIADLIPFIKGTLFIPIYMTDSIASAKKMTLVGNVYSLTTTVGEFLIPTVFINSKHRLRFFNILEESIMHDYNFNEFKGRLKEYFPENEVNLLRDLFQQFKKLEKEGKNRIWTRLLVNTFAPFTTGKFRYVLGNPPWIGWESLPRAYREATQDLWKRYNLFSIKKGAEARLGGGKKDISMLFVHRCIDLYLIEGGELIFLITQTIFQSVKTGEGFRKFDIGQKGREPFKVVKVDDMVDLKPFRATNQTSIIYCEKGGETEYPINYDVWLKTKRKDLADNSLSLREVEQYVLRRNYLAQPSSGKPYTPWIIYPATDSQMPHLIKKLCGKSRYIGKAGVCTWLNGVFWVKIIERFPDGKILIENLGEIGRKKVNIVRAKIEPDLVYPLIRGRDVELWNLNSTDNYYIIVTNDPVTRKGIEISRMRVGFPLTYNYLNSFKDKLIARSGYKKYFQSDDPFYSIYNVESRLFAPYRILWPEIGEFKGCIIREINDQFLGRKLPVPNNKAMYAPIADEEEAYFLAGFVNSRPLRKYIGAKQLITSTTTKLIAEMKIPDYDKTLEEHKKVIKLAKKLEKNKEDEKTLEELEEVVLELIG